MSVTFLVPDTHGLAGGQRIIAQYAAFLQGRGHRVQFVVRRPGDPSDGGMRCTS